MKGNAVTVREAHEMSQHSSGRHNMGTSPHTPSAHPFVVLSSNGKMLG